MRRLVILLALVAGTACVPGAADAAPRWISLAPATLERTEVAAGRIGRHVYVVGGFERAGGATTAATERYDIVRDRWTRVADMPVALNHPAAATYRGRLYVLGGYRAATGLTAETAAMYRYSPRRDRWRREPSMPTARGALAVGVVGHRLYAAGGASARRGALGTLEIYDFARRRWRSGPAMGVAREHLAGAVAGGRFYAIAGRTAEAGNLAVVEAYDPRRRRWARLPDLPTPRHGLGAVARRGRVFVLAGGATPGLAFTGTVEALRLDG